MGNLRIVLVPPVALLIFLILAGCASYAWYNPNKNEIEFAGDKVNCDRQAASMYPPQFQQVQLTSGYQAPSQTTCYPIGYSVSCTTIPGRYVPPVSMTVDANQANREIAFKNCMNSLGWSLIRTK